MNHGTGTQNHPDYALTPRGLDALRAELATLRERRASVSADDRDEQYVLESRLAALEDILDQAWVVDPATLSPGEVAIGTTVELRDLDANRNERYRVVGKHEPLRAGDLSAASAVGQALLERRAGDSVSAELPNGRVRRFEVVSVERTPLDA